MTASTEEATTLRTLRTYRAEVAVVVVLVLASAATKWAFDLASTAWSAAVDVTWQVLLLVVLVRTGSRRGESLADVSGPLSRSAVWDIVLLFLAGSVVYAAISQLIGGLVPGLDATERAFSPRDVHGVGALPALTLAIVGPLLGEAILRGHLQTRLRQLSAPSWLGVGASVLLQTSLYLERGVVPAVALGAQLLVFAVYYHRSRRLWPIMVAHAMQSGIGLAALTRTTF